MFVKILCYALVSAVFVQAMRIPRQAEEATTTASAEDGEATEADPTFLENLGDKVLDAVVDHAVENAIDGAIKGASKGVSKLKEDKQTTKKPTTTQKKTRRTDKKRKG